MPIHWTPLETRDVVTFLAAALAYGVGLRQYRSTSRDEFVKPIREAQLKAYMEASGAAAILATAPSGGPEWNKAKLKFLRLYYGPLAMFEDFQHRQPDVSPKKDSGQTDDKITVERAMIAFKSCLDDKDCVGSLQMRNLSLALAHTCRHSLGSSWKFKAAQLQGDFQELIRVYEKKRKEHEK